MSEDFGFKAPEVSDQEIRINDTDWIQFGAAVIGSARRIDVHLNGMNTVKFTVGESTFEKLQQWVSKHFQEKLNYSVVNPSYSAVISENWCVLYSDASGASEKMLVTMPISTRTLGLSGDKFLEAMSAVRRIIA